MSQIIIDDKENILNTYKRFNVVLTKGNGSILVDEDGKEDYIGMSPDSIQLVRAARLQGYQLTKAETSKYRRIKYEPYNDVKKEETNNENIQNNGIIQDFELLNIIPFSSDRKRESVIVKDNNIIKLYIKGADTIIEQRLSKDTNKNIFSKFQESVNYFSSQGFRTLFVG